MKQFEYFTYLAGPTISIQTAQDYLNQMGKQGWELINVVPLQTHINECITQPNLAHYFKRRIPIKK